MRLRVIGIAIAAMLLGMLASGGRGLAAVQTYRVQLDAAPPLGQPWAFLRLFPNDYLTVHRGDVINAAWAGVDTPHTATFVATAHIDQWRATNQQQGGPYAVFALDIASGGDEQGTILNPAVLGPSDPTCGSEGKPCSFDGTSVLNSGVNFPNQQAEPSFFVSVNAPVGQYAMLCLLHPGMQIPLIVLPSGADIPSPAEVAARAAGQVRIAKHIEGPRADRQAQHVRRVDIGGGHVRLVISAGGFVDNVSANEYLDRGLTIHVGDQLLVRAGGEIHTATFPRGAFRTVPFVLPQCEVAGNHPDTPTGLPPTCADPTLFELAFNPKAVTPTHFNGLSNPRRFVNSGLLGPIVPSYTFVALMPGTYTMVCLVHGPEMSTTITVVG